MVETSNMREVRSDVAAIFDRIADQYDAHMPYFGSFAADLIAWRPPGPSLRLLDVGTGNAACLISIGASPARSMVGIDLSERMLVTARARCGDAGIEVDLVRADAHHLPFGAESFDAIYCASTWPFFKQPDQVAAELRRTSNPGTSMALSVMTRGEHTWPFLKQALAQYSPVSTRPAEPESDGTDAIVDCLRRAGWRVNETREVSHEFEFGTADQWLAWHWSHYGRRHLERVDASRLSQLLEHLVCQAETVRKEVGLRIEQRACFISAIA